MQHFPQRVLPRGLHRRRQGRHPWHHPRRLSVPVPRQRPGRVHRRRDQDRRRVGHFRQGVLPRVLHRRPQGRHPWHHPRRLSVPVPRQRPGRVHRRRDQDRRRVGHFRQGVLPRVLHRRPQGRHPWHHPRRLSVPVPRQRPGRVHRRRDQDRRRVGHFRQGVLPRVLHRRPQGRHPWHHPRRLSVPVPRQRPGRVHRRRDQDRRRVGHFRQGVLPRGLHRRPQGRHPWHHPRRLSVPVPRQRPGRVHRRRDQDRRRVGHFRQGVLPRGLHRRPQGRHPWHHPRRLPVPVPWQRPGRVHRRRDQDRRRVGHFRQGVLPRGLHRRPQGRHPWHHPRRLSVPVPWQRPGRVHRRRDQDRHRMEQLRLGCAIRVT